MTSHGPPPPPGPGVQPPFAAPPIDADRTRVWVGLGVGAAALLLCCIGSVAGVGGLLVTGVQAIREQARATVSDYLEALTKKEYADAYALLCDSRQDDETVQRFTARLARGPQVTGYSVGEARLDESQAVVRVPADVRYEGGQQRQLRFLLEQDSRSGRFEICGVE